MNFSSILSEIERLDPEVYERTSARRSVIKNWSRRVSLAALPMALGSLLNKAYGQSTSNPIVDILQFALTLEQLESEFYRLGIQATQVNPPKTQLIPTVTGLELPAFQMIYKHEQAHVSFLSGVINAMGKIPNAMPKFDFTGGKGTGAGPFTQVFSDYGTFLAVAQTFEDTGVRAYKGQATALKSDNDVLTSALRIHSIEARHAAHIRLIRSQTPGPLSDGLNIKPWITLAQSGINSPDVQASYDGEQNTSQLGVEVINIAGFVVPDTTASESFDEPLTKDQVLAIVAPFIAP